VALRVMVMNLISIVFGLVDLLRTQVTRVIMLPYLKRLPKQLVWQQLDRIFGKMGKYLLTTLRHYMGLSVSCFPYKRLQAQSSDLYHDRQLWNLSLPRLSICQYHHCPGLVSKFSICDCSQLPGTVLF
jgi:hypothetical protein